jgi:hypothetical protein
MRITPAATRALAAPCALAMLASCSSGTSRLNPTAFAQPGANQPIVQQGLPSAYLWNNALTPSHAKLSAHPETRSYFNLNAKDKPLIFASDQSNVVDIFLQGKGNAQIGQIVGDLDGPYGLAADRDGNVYIPNSNGATVVVFKPPYTKWPKLTLDDAGKIPVDVAVSAPGLVAVANSNASINFYKKNSTEPCATVSDTSFGTITHDTFDDKGTLYIDGENGSGFTVGRIRGGCNATTIERLTTENITGDNSGGIKINKLGQIAIDDDVTLAIYTYDRPKNGSLGSPVTTTPLTGSAGPYDFAFAASGDQLYVADYLNRAIEEYAYPAGGNAEATIPIGDTTQGVAVTPPVVP